jgi:hypothetical protein
MSDQDKAAPETEAGGANSDDPNVDEIGFKKPPKKHRFQKGRSGNPAGRPKGKKGRRAIIERVLLEKRIIEISGKPRELTMIELAVLALRQEAMSGKSRAFKTYRSVEGRYGPQESKNKAGHLVIPYVETIEQWMALWGPDGQGWKKS